jgi:hemoglobin/transferrin/lactoferrin receptor protein
LATVIAKRIKLDMAAYYTLLNDALVRRNYQLNGQDSILYDGNMSRVQAVQNAATATVYGIQAGVELKLPHGFALSGRYNVQIGEEELDDGTKSPSRHAPPAFGMFRLSYTARKFSMQMYTQFSGKRLSDDLPQEEVLKTEIYAIDANGKPWSPGWYTLNFKTMYQFEEHLSLSAGLENITDQRYRPYSSGIVAAGRNFVLSMSAHF